MNIWDIISNPPNKKIQGINVPKWQVPALKDREAMVDAINEAIVERLKGLPYSSNVEIKEIIRELEECNGE